MDRYLARLGIADRPAPTLDGLRQLHRAHIRAIPFENSSVLRGEPIPLELSLLADKILVAGRGGFCYELNGLFAALLEALGFSVQRRGARVFGADTEVGPPLDHLCLEVPIEGEPWLADVGFGYSYLEPLRLVTDLEQEDPSGRFRIVTKPATDTDPEGLDLEWLHRDGAWRGHYRIEPGAHVLADFQAMCDYQRTSTQAPFLGGWLCSRATDDGFVTVFYRELIVSRGRDVVERRTIDDDVELATLLTRWFNL